MRKPSSPRIETGVRNLDALLHGGLPQGSLSVSGGSPGAGKRGLEEAAKRIMQHVTKFKPAIVVIDSFKVFDDLAGSREEHRKFCYQLGAILLSATEQGVERRRYVEVYKLRNTAHATGRYEMSIGPGGITAWPHASPPKKSTPKLRGRAKARR